MGLFTVVLVLYKLQAPLRVHITDVNDHDPQFTEVIYNFSSPETNRTSYVVGIVSATDDDLGDNGNITYSIISADVKQLFSIDQVIFLCQYVLVSPLPITIAEGDFRLDSVLSSVQQISCQHFFFIFIGSMIHHFTMASYRSSLSIITIR